MAKWGKMSNIAWSLNTFTHGPKGSIMGTQAKNGICYTHGPKGSIMGVKSKNDIKWPNGAKMSNIAWLAMTQKRQNNPKVSTAQKSKNQKLIILVNFRCQTQVGRNNWNKSKSKILVNFRYYPQSPLQELERGGAAAP